MPQRLPQLCCNVDGKFPPPQSIHLKFTLFFDLQLVQYKFLCFYFACVCVYKYFGGTPRYYIFVNKNKNWRFWKILFTGLLELIKPYKIKPNRDFIIFIQFLKVYLGFKFTQLASESGESNGHLTCKSCMYSPPMKIFPRQQPAGNIAQHMTTFLPLFDCCLMMKQRMKNSHCRSKIHIHIRWISKSLGNHTCKL